MLELRIAELSIFYFLKGKLDDSGWGSTGYYNSDVVTLMDAYPNDDELNKIVATPTNMPDTEIVLPIVVIEMVDQRGEPFELGSNDAANRSFAVSVLGREKAETRDLAQQVYEWFRDENVYLRNYNQGFPPDVEPNIVSAIDVDNVTLLPVRIVGSPDVADKHRYEITFNATTYLVGSSEETVPV